MKKYTNEKEVRTLRAVLGKMMLTYRSEDVLKQRQKDKGYT